MTRTVEPPPCDCPPSAGVRRRTVLQGMAAGMGMAAAGSFAGEAAAPSYAFADGYSGDVLVVLSLRGGFDGLSAVVPGADADYMAARGPLALPTSRLLQLDATFGLNPAMQALKPFWDSGSLAFVHAVGQADPSRSHFEAMAEMERAAPGTSLRSGWLDRTLGLRTSTGPFTATQLGWGGVTGALVGPTAETVLPGIAEFTLDGGWNATETARWDRALTAMHRGATSSLAQPANTALAAARTTTRLEAAGYTPAAGAAYADNDLSKQLRDVARLVKAGVGLQVACVELDDWDMHVDLGTVDAGRMKDRLTILSEALAAFATDLGAGLANVTVVTLSEFGRRLEQNGSGGVDHGHGNVVMVLGGGTIGGHVYGTWPGLAADALVDGDLAGTTDYRTILGEILQKRCGAGSLSSIFPGFSAPAPLGLTTLRA